jgi:hypothetical protein
MKMRLLITIMTLGMAEGFAPMMTSPSYRTSTTTSFSTTETSPELSIIEPKEAVKLFGRLAEKYIMLDESGGLCCYSGCKDCEYRLPDGGYRMADQSAARPKWIPVYEERFFPGVNKRHKTRWSTEIFINCFAVTKEDFVNAMVDMAYAPPLGGPYVGASAGTLEDTTATERLFDLLAGGKVKLSRHKMSVRLKELAGGEQGLTWTDFSAALGL